MQLRTATRSGSLQPGEFRQISIEVMFRLDGVGSPLEADLASLKFNATIAVLRS